MEKSDLGNVRLSTAFDGGSNLDLDFS